MESNILAVDLGGTLSKVAISCSENLANKVLSDLSNTKVDSMEISFKEFTKDYKLFIYLVIFAKIDDFFDFMHTKIFENFDDLKIFATGGGALKHQQKFKQFLEKTH